MTFGPPCGMQDNKQVLRTGWLINNNYYQFESLRKGVVSFVSRFFFCYVYGVFHTAWWRLQFATRWSWNEKCVENESQLWLVDKCRVIARSAVQLLKQPLSTELLTHHPFFSICTLAPLWQRRDGPGGPASVIRMGHYLRIRRGL